MELVVAGGLRVIRDDQLPHLFSLFDSPLGQIALTQAVRKKCLVLCALPQVQVYYERQFLGQQLSGGPNTCPKEYLQKLLLTPQAALRDILLLCTQLLFLPAVAVYPPLQQSRYLAYSPAFR
eukprot:7388349-Prymnesium_polylepis.4